MKKILSIIIALFIIQTFELRAENISPSEASPSEKTYLELKEILHKGGFNAKLFLELEKYTASSSEKIAYLRQAMVLEPSNKTIREKIFDIKQVINSDTSPKKLNQKNSWIDILSLKSYLPFYLIDYIFIFSSTILIGSIFLKKGNLVSYTLLFLLPLYALMDKLLICYTRDGSLRVINTISDITKTEGISLREMKTYASQDTESQITALIKPGSELDIEVNSPNPGDWVKVKFENGRSGWYIYEPEELFIIRH